MMRIIALLVLCAVWWLGMPSNGTANPSTFTYYPPGSIQPKTGAEEELSTGYADYDVHTPGIGFPLTLPAFANSQYYRPGGEGAPKPNKGQCDPANYDFPWRDNYCESRLGSNRVNEFCPNGYGHQGQDIRPSECKIDYFEVRAVEDSTVAFEPEIGELVLFSKDKKRLYDYLHMETAQYTKDPKTGKTVEVPDTRVEWHQHQEVTRGKIIGYVSSILGTKDNTTRHLHFGLRKQKFDSKGRPLSGGRYFYHSPYMSLVRAYEAALGKEGTMLPVPQVCQPNTARCTTKSIITCNGDGTAETLTPCTTAQCKNDTVCKTGVAQPVPDMSVPVAPHDMSVSSPSDMSAVAPPDLSTTCDPRACLCGCNGALCRNQVCSPRSAYCTTATTLIECSSDGCSSLTKSCGYGCSGGRCNDPPGTVDMSVPPSSVDMSVPPPKTEVCNGLDDDGNGIVDDPATCWQWITRFKDPITQARCYGVGSIPPFACSAYDREFVLFAVPTTLWSDGSNSLWVQCSRGVDHVLTAYGSTEYGALTTLGWNCSLQLGYFFNQGLGPRFPKKTPFTYTCPLYRQRFTTSGSQSHFYTPFSESVAGATCEPPARADVVTVNACGVAVGC